MSGLETILAREGPPESDEEYEELLNQVRAWACGLVAAAIVSARDQLTLIPLDMPGMWVQWLASTKSLGARVVVGVPDELIRNAAGPPEKRDFVALLHIPRSLQDALEGARMPDLVLPDKPQFGPS